jgi:hypothetical protein
MPLICQGLSIAFLKMKAFSLNGMNIKSVDNMYKTFYDCPIPNSYKPRKIAVLKCIDLILFARQRQRQRQRIFCVLAHLGYAFL